MLKRAVRTAVFRLPGGRSAWMTALRLFGRAGVPRFAGWGMTTETLPPWHAGGGDETVKRFVRVHDDVVERVRAGRFHLSQFADEPDLPRLLRELMWRHYVVFWSVRFAAGATGCAVKTLVECGVCDGLTSYFAISALAGEHPYRAFLYDAWQAMAAPYLLDSERDAVGQYDYLSLERTRENLRAFESATTFVKGFVPDSFDSQPMPTDVVWLHLDLNAAVPTRAALDRLYDRMPVGAVILFDDYGWTQYQDTKAAIEAFVAGKPGFLMPLPTGQAVFFKR